jgi:hypothetical protein
VEVAAQAPAVEQAQVRAAEELVVPLPRCLAAVPEDRVLVEGREQEMLLEVASGFPRLRCCAARLWGVVAVVCLEVAGLAEAEHTLLRKKMCGPCSAFSRS